MVSEKVFAVCRLVVSLRMVGCVHRSVLMCSVDV
jgi:hypothetical protein